MKKNEKCVAGFVTKCLLEPLAGNLTEEYQKRLEEKTNGLYCRYRAENSSFYLNFVLYVSAAAAIGWTIPEAKADAALIAGTAGSIASLLGGLENISRIWSNGYEVAPSLYGRGVSKVLDLGEVVANAIKK